MASQDAGNQFLRVVEALLTPNNQVRKQAEQAYNQYVESNAPAAASLLLQIACQAPTPQLRQICAVLLRRLVSTADSFTKFPGELVANLQEHLIVSIFSTLSRT